MDNEYDEGCEGQHENCCGCGTCDCYYTDVLDPDDYRDNDYAVDGVTEYDPWYDEWDEEVDWGEDE